MGLKQSQSSQTHSQTRLIHSIQSNQFIQSILFKQFSATSVEHHIFTVLNILAVLGSIAAMRSLLQHKQPGSLLQKSHRLRQCSIHRPCVQRVPQKRAAVKAATSAAAAFDDQLKQLNAAQPLQKLCKNVLVGVAAAAAWSVAASAVGGSATPWASLTLTTTPGASGETFASACLQQHMCFEDINHKTGTSHSSNL